MARKRKSAASRGTLETELREVGRRLDGLLAQARKAEAGARKSTLRELQALQRKQLAAQRAVAHLARQGAAAGGPLLAGLFKAWHDMEAAARQAARQFRRTG